jgi:hypothetical protein
MKLSSTMAGFTALSLFAPSFSRSTDTAHTITLREDDLNRYGGSVAPTKASATASTISNNWINEHTSPRELYFIKSADPHLVINQLGKCQIRGYYYKQESRTLYTICFELNPGPSTPQPPYVCSFLRIDAVEGKTVHQVVDAMMENGMKGLESTIVHWKGDADTLVKAGLEYFSGNGWQYEKFDSKQRMIVKDEL